MVAAGSRPSGLERGGPRGLAARVSVARAFRTRRGEPTRHMVARSLVLWLALCLTRTGSVPVPAYAPSVKYRRHGRVSWRMSGYPMVVDVIIPALNEERSVGSVVQGLLARGVRRVFVVDNGSTDRTAACAREAGAFVVREPQRGYGRACLTGIASLALDAPDVVVFCDADASDDPDDLVALLSSISAGADLVIGSRSRGESERGALLPQARFGNWLATRLIRRLYGVTFTDLGPFRAIRTEALLRLDMQDVDFGWTVEMQIKAAKVGLRCAEVPVRYRRRVGASKISGTLWGSVRAGHKILYTIARERDS